MRKWCLFDGNNDAADQLARQIPRCNLGLFSSVLHLRDVQSDQLEPALDDVLRDARFFRDGAGTIAAAGPYRDPAHRTAAENKASYLVSPLKGRWITLIEAHRGTEGVPHLSDLGQHLSGRLECYALSLFVHDDDLFLYNLDYNGSSLDRYNSCPQYFEQERLTEDVVEEERHHPGAFISLLPEGVGIDQLKRVLDQGWWDAYNSGRLDENGVAPGEDQFFGNEAERMTAFGTLLRLHGDGGKYPYAAWGGNSAIDWPSFRAIYYKSLNAGKARPGDRRFYEALGEERPDVPCRTSECKRGAIKGSVYCRRHHFEKMKGRECPFDD